jgi:hypothetical protein
VEGFSPIVQALVLAMINSRSILGARSANAAPLGVQLVGDDGPRLAPFFEALAEKALGCRFVTPGTHQNVAAIPVGKSGSRTINPFAFSKLKNRSDEN